MQREWLDSRPQICMAVRDKNVPALRTVGRDPTQYSQRLTPGRKGNNDLDQNFGRRSQALTALRSTGLLLRRRNTPGPQARRPQDLRQRLAP